MKHKMKLLERPFNNILNGTKQIEFRLYDEKRQNIKVGDIIEFAKLPDLKQTINVVVEDLYQYPTFQELLISLGYQEEKLTKQLDEIFNIYTKEQEQKYGVLGIKIKLIK